MSKPLTTDYYSAHIEPIISGCEEKECHAYQSEIGKSLQQENLDESKKEIIRLFHSVVSYMLSPDSPNEPFKPLFIMGNQRSSIPSDLTPENRGYLEQILPKIADNELRARIADTLWTLRHGKAREHAETAIESYIASANNLLKKSWHCTYQRLERAFRIFLQLGLGNKEVADEKNVIQKILEYIEQGKTENSPFLAMRLIALLHGAQRADNERHAVILEDIAISQESTNHDAARKAWDLAAQLHKRAKKPDDVIRCQSNAAETYVKLAELEESRGQPSYMRISTWLQSAVEAYRNIPRKKQRRDEIYARLIQCQPKIRDEMQVFSTEIDASSLINSAVEAVSGHDAYTALYKFAFLLQPPQLEETEKEVKLQAEETPLSYITPTTFHDRKGRVIARSSSEDSLENKMHRHISQFHRNFYAKSVLIPAIQQIRLEHNISLADWVALLKNHPFVPPERVLAYAHGFFHGFHGDFLSAAHILIPQIENSVRYVLNNYEKQTSKQIEGGVQEESSLNQTLVCEEIKEIFGEDLVFDLKGLLIEKMGENLRNSLSHGLLDDDQLLAPELAYLYWLTLHIIFLPVRAMIANEGEHA